MRVVVAVIRGVGYPGTYSVCASRTRLPAADTTAATTHRSVIAGPSRCLLGQPPPQHGSVGALWAPTCTCHYTERVRECQRRMKRDSHFIHQKFIFARRSPRSRGLSVYRTFILAGV